LGQLYCPRGIAVDDNVVVVDRYNHHIQKFSKDVNWMLTIGKQGTGQCEFKFPYAIDVCKTDGRVFVSNIERHRIQALSPDSNFLFKFGLEACENGQFQSASKLALSHCGQYIFACDCNKYHIQILNALNGDFNKSYASNGNYPFEIHT
jgi:tripartite motif-containing protein 71